MAAHPGPLSEAGAESSLQEVNWQLRSQLEKSTQDFLDLKEKFLVSEATAYSLANQLRKYSKSCQVLVPKAIALCSPSEKCKASPDALSPISSDNTNFILTTVRER